MDLFEREEGELLSDEELDDVSDNSSLSSTPILLEGKSSPLVGREPFRELSLTSVSDDSDDVAIVEQKCRLAKQTRDISRDITRDIRRRQCKHRRDVWYRQRSRRSPTPERRVERRRPTRKRYSSSPDSGHHYAAHRTIYRQLRNAVRVNQSQHLPNISLRSRLKRLIPDSPKDNSDEEDLKVLRDQALQSTKPVIEPQDQNNSVTDEDLIQLRLDALHSAVLKKHQDRRKRKELELKKLEEEKQIAAEEQKSMEILEDIAQEVTETVPDAEKNDTESIVISALQTVVQNHQERIRKLSVSADAQIEAIPDIQDSTPAELPVDMEIQDDDVENLELLSALQTTVIINQQERKRRKSSSNEVQDQCAAVPENDVMAAQPSVDTTDLEIFNALKTVVKKHEERRKRKESFTEHQSVATETATNKIDAITVQPSIELDVQNNDVEILKQLSALQTAVIKTHQNRRKRKSISSEVQPIVNIKPEIQENDVPVQPIALEHESPKSNVEEDEDILRAMLLTSISKKISNKKLTNNVIHNNNNNNNKIPIRSTNPPAEIKVPVKIPKIGPVKRLVINVNTDSDSDCDHHTVVNNDIFDKSLSLFLQQARAKSESDHTSDITKHLPQSQQLEYKRLKRKLQQLTTKSIRKNSDENKRIKLATNIQGHTSNRQAPGKTSVNQKKPNKVGRLQMKGKYEELSPLMARVTEAHNVREKAQSDVKRLINDLRVARTKLTTTHQNYTVLIQELVSAKSAIEKRSDDQNVKFVKATPVICTSTPNKTFVNREISCELSNIDKSIVAEVPKPACLETCTTKITEVPVPEVENIEVMKDVPVEQIIDKKETQFLKYISPLDHIKCSEQSTSNPLLILCPYDLLGECRDQDCAYRHCGNNAP